MNKKTIIGKIVQEAEFMINAPQQTDELCQLFTQKQSVIEAWFREQWQALAPPLYSSVDLRNSGFKFSAVDTNLFPAGFNNLSKDCLPLAIQSMQTFLSLHYPQTKSILLIAESQTRNIKYFENLYALKNILENAGYDIVIGTFLELPKAKTIALSNDNTITIYPALHQDGLITANAIAAELIILNDDMTSGSFAPLHNTSQAVLPSIELGWDTRRKSQHFSHLEAVCQQFSEVVDSDPWLISPYFGVCNEIDFTTGEGQECLTQQIETMLAKIRVKYQEYGIEHDPFVVVKADAGTYGMGVMMVKSAEDVRNMNRKQRSKMAKLKGGRELDKVILQEGVYSFETISSSRHVAEPVVYMIGEHVIGGFYRVHTERGADENLNAAGMHFHPQPFASSCVTPKNMPAHEHADLFYSYGVIGRLAALAAAHEMK